MNPGAAHGRLGIANPGVLREKEAWKQHVDAGRTDLLGSEATLELTDARPGRESIDAGASDRPDDLHDKVGRIGRNARRIGQKSRRPNVVRAGPACRAVRVGRPSESSGAAHGDEKMSLNLPFTVMVCSADLIAGS